MSSRLGKGNVVAGRSAIGLDIGTSGVRAAELSFGKRGVTLDKFGQVELPDGAVRDGEVIDPDAVATAIKQLWAGTKFSSRKVVIGVANSKVVVRQVDLPWMPAGELKASLGFHVEDLIPFPVDAAVLDFYALEELENELGQRIVRGLLVAASRPMVDASIAAVQKAGLEPVLVDLSSFAVLRSLAEVDNLGTGAAVEALVDVGAKVTNIVVHQGGAPRFVRILLLGGHDVTVAVADRMGVPLEQAEGVKQQLGMSGNGAQAEDEAVVRVIDAVASQFVDEIRGSLDYYTASSGSAAISRLVLTGGGARLDGLARRLELATRVPVELGHPIDRLSIGKTGLTAEQIQFLGPLAAVPVGLALGAE